MAVRGFDRDAPRGGGGTTKPGVAQHPGPPGDIHTLESRDPWVPSLTVNPLPGGRHRNGKAVLMTADVRVGIVAWNVAEDLRRCLVALPAALGNLNAEVVVVDNASTDDSAAVAAASGVRLLRAGRNVGYARAMNRALARTDARALIALNPDTVPPPGSLAALVADLDAHPEAGLVAPRLLNPDGGVQHSVHRFPTLKIMSVVGLVPWRWLPETFRDRLWLPGSTHAGRSGPIDWAVGAVHGIRRAALDGPRPYRERWFVYVEDLDLCWRLQRAGWGVRLAAEVTVVHRGNASGRQAFGSKRRARWLHETYDWYGLVFGAPRTRLFALLNLLIWVRIATATLLRALRPRCWRARQQLRRLGEEARLHFRVLLLGPPPPAGPPGGPGGPTPQ